MWVECSLDWINKLIQNSFTEYFPKHCFSIRKFKHALHPIFNLKNPSACPQRCSIPTSRQEFQAAVFEVNASFYPCFILWDLGLDPRPYKRLKLLPLVLENQADEDCTDKISWSSSCCSLEKKTGILGVLCARESKNLDGLIFTLTQMRAHLLFCRQYWDLIHHQGNPPWYFGKKHKHFLESEWMWEKIRRTWSF